MIYCIDPDVFPAAGQIHESNVHYDKSGNPWTIAISKRGRMFCRYDGIRPMSRTLTIDVKTHGIARSYDIRFTGFCVFETHTLDDYCDLRFVIREQKTVDIICSFEEMLAERLAKNPMRIASELPKGEEWNAAKEIKPFGIDSNFPEALVRLYEALDKIQPRAEEDLDDQRRRIFSAFGLPPHVLPLNPADAPKFDAYTASRPAFVFSVDQAAQHAADIVEGPIDVSGKAYHHPTPDPKKRTRPDGCMVALVVLAAAVFILIFS